MRSIQVQAVEQGRYFAVVNKISEEERLSISPDAKDALFEVCEARRKEIRKYHAELRWCLARILMLNYFSMASVAKPKEVNEVLSLAHQRKLSGIAEEIKLSLMLDYGLSGLVRRFCSPEIRKSTEHNTNSN